MCGFIFTSDGYFWSIDFFISFLYSLWLYGQRKTTLSLQLTYIFAIRVQVCTTERFYPIKLTTQL